MVNRLTLLLLIAAASCTPSPVPTAWGDQGPHEPAPPSADPFKTHFPKPRTPEQVARANETLRKLRAGEPL